MPGARAKLSGISRAAPQADAILLCERRSGERPVKRSATDQETVADADTRAEFRKKSRPGYSNRVPAAVAQPVPMRLSSASKISIADLEANSSPPAPSSKAAVTFCDPRRTPLAL